MPEEKVVEKKGEDLVIEARNFFNFYKKEIGKSVRAGKNVIFVNFGDIASFSHILAEQLVSTPEEIFQVLEVALEESGLITNPRIRLLDLPEMQFIRVRNIRAKHLNQLISIEGIVRQASDVRPQVVNAKFECPSCGTIISVLQIEKRFREPSRCSCGRKGQFRLISKDMVDAQRIVIEESPESLVGGEQPRRISVFLKEDLVDPKMEERTTPGNRVKTIGVLKEVPVPLQTGSISTRFDLAIEANNIIPLEETFEEFEISEEDERQIQELAADKQILQKMIDSIAPSIFGYDEIKQALVLQLFGGVKKKRADGTDARGDVHIMLVGDPGVAKSIILKFMSTLAPKGRYVVGRGTSAAGLTCTVVRDEFLRGWALEAGAMVLSNKGLVAIDEIEKMNPEDRSAMHEALEQQCYLPNLEITLADNSKKKIGTFVDSLINRYRKKVQKGIDCEILPLNENIKILTTNFESIYSTKIDKVSRHIAPDKFIKIKLRNGREITVTPRHPCWTIKNEKIITIPAQNLVEGNFFPIPARKKVKWIKVESTKTIKNKDIKWVYDITVEPTHSFISNNMILHNSVTISKANVQASLRAETSVLAAANPKLGRFEPFQVIAQQIDMPPTLLNRFDVIFILRDLPDRGKDEAIATHVLLEHKKEGKKQAIDKELFRKYIAYAKQRVQPMLTDAAVDEIKKFYVELRNAPVSAEGVLKPIPISARQLEALIRLSEASARARLTKRVSREDAKLAIEIIKYYLMQVGFDQETKTFDIDRIATGVSTSQRGRIILVREALSRLESRMGKLIPIEEIYKELEEKMPKEEIEDGIQKLKQTGDIFEPRKGYVQRV